MSTEASAVAGAKAGPLEAYHEKSALNNGFKGAIQSGAFGLFVSAVQNSLATHKHGAMGIFTRTGSSIGLFAAIGAAYGVTESFVSNLRHRDDSVNSAVGACASGLVIGASGEFFFFPKPYICAVTHSDSIFLYSLFFCSRFNPYNVWILCGFGCCCRYIRRCRSFINRSILCCFG